MGTIRWRSMVPMGTMSSESAVSDDLKDIRSRILGAAFDSFVEHGYAETTTIEIATRAKVSKRELYALVGNKQEMLAACIRSPARRRRRSLSCIREGAATDECHRHRAKAALIADAARGERRYRREQPLVVESAPWGCSPSRST